MEIQQKDENKCGHFTLLPDIYQMVVSIKSNATQKNRFEKIHLWLFVTGFFYLDKTIENMADSTTAKIVLSPAM